MHLYKIRNWNELFENNRSRSVAELRWVLLPVKHDGENYSRIMSLPEDQASKVFCAWVGAVQVAARCHPRGTLVRGDGTPHTPLSLSLKTRMPENWFETGLAWLAENTDWIEVQEVADGCQAPVRQVPPKCQAPDDRIEWNGTEQKYTHTAEIPSEKEVLAMADLVGVAAESAKRFFDHHQGNQLWINQYGRLIDVRHKLKSWGERDRTKQPAKAAGVQLVVHNDELRRVESDLKTIRQRKHPDFGYEESDKRRLKELKSRQSELRELLGVKV